MEFEQRVHASRSGSSRKRANSGYPPMLVHYHRMQPFVATDSGTPQMPAAAASSVHRFGGQGRRARGLHRHHLQLPASVPCRNRAGDRARSAEHDRRDLGRGQTDDSGDVLESLGWANPLVYTEPLGRLGLDIETIGGELRTLLNAAILAVMEGRDEDVGFVAYEAIDVLRARNVDGIILGCTENPAVASRCGERTGPDQPAAISR